MTIRIVKCAAADELYRHYDGQTEAQPVYIELDLRNGTLQADYNSNIGNGVLETVYHGIDRHYSIPILTADAANRVMEEILPYASRIHADWEEVWDGNNHVAELGEDAQAAEEEIRAHLQLTPEYDIEPNQGFDDSDLVTVWDIDSATNGQETSEYNITAETTDERLDAIAIEITNELVDASPSGVIAVPGLHRYLRSLRDDLEEKDTE
jgi:hypothetical protein